MDCFFAEFNISVTFAVIFLIGQWLYINNHLLELKSFTGKQFLIKRQPYWTMRDQNLIHKKILICQFLEIY